jgi:hypothetical protein
MCKIIEDEHEDRRVTTAALAGFCNLLLNFSPLREASTFYAIFTSLLTFQLILLLNLLQTILGNGMMRRIASLTMSTDHSLRLNAVWAIRNSTYKAAYDESKHIMSQVGWDKLLQ